LAEQKDAGPKNPAPKGGGGPLNSVWKFFSSLKLTVILLIILALVSIIGTIVAQDDPMKNMSMMVGLFGQEKAAGALNLLIALGITHMYHSWWFVLLLLLLSANIAICTIERLPRVIQMVMKKQAPLTDATIKNMTLRKEIKVTGDIEAAAERAKGAVKAMGYSPNEYRSGGEVQYFAEKGKFSRLGVYIAHLSVLLIFAGALIGTFWGYKGWVQITEGGLVDTIGLTQPPLLLKVGPEMPLPFQVRCDKFQLKLYPSGMPSDYLSTLTVVDGGKDVLTKTIRVNDPLEYKGIRFFQSSYGISPSQAAMTIRVTSKGPGFSVHDYTLHRGERTALEGSDISMTLVDMSPDVVIGPNHQLIAQGDQFNGRGVAIVNFTAPDGSLIEQAVILNQDPYSQPRKVPYVLGITAYGGPYYTGLQVTHDPGVLVVWLGCTLLVLGILVAFFIFHKRVWVRVIRSDSGEVTVTAVGSTNKNRGAFEAEFARLLDKLESKQ
jgi:cytochrome c biogenesis protein